MPAYPLFSGPGGIDPVRHIDKLIPLARPTIGDALHAGKYKEARIRENTQRGVDASGASFVPYSPAYKKQKARVLGTADPVNLFGTSRRHMLMSMVVRANGLEQPAVSNAVPDDRRAASLVQVGIWDEEQATKARVHNEGATIPTRLGTGRGGRKPKRNGKAAAAIPKRQFFQVVREDTAAMERIIGLRIEQRLKQQQNQRIA